VADAILGQTELLTREEIDFAICNSGGLRVPSLPAGPITRGHFYELMPFDNYLVTMQLPGTVIKKLFDTMAAASGWPISAGVTYQIKDKRAQNIMIRGAILDDLKTYHIALSDYLAEGGGDCSFLKDYPYQNLNIYYRDALIEYALSKHARSQSLDARIEGRVVSLDH
jgi:2',3'-cyclic-nucleotide 2'-phosphodiesterase (5'-nucleotidase family)